MKKLFIAVLLLCFTMPVMAKDIPFITTATLQNGEQMIINGTLKGIDVPPTFGFYVSEITNAASFKGESFSLMRCTVHKNPKSIHIKNPVELKTVYQTDDGFTEVTGVVEALDVYPAEGYVVSIANGKNIREWSNLKCTIK